MGFPCLPLFNSKTEGVKMKRIKATKSGRWAQDEPWKKQVVMVDGREYGEREVPAGMMEQFVDKGFAEYVEDEVKEKAEGESGEDKEPVGIRKTIAEVIADGADKNKKKDLLEAWALEELKIDIDKRKGLDFLIEFVAVAHEEANG